MDLKNNDILIFKNGSSTIFTKDKRKIIQYLYDGELRCINNDDYTIVRVYRPHYELVYGDYETKRKIK